ncbi:MAG: hypothetical protein HKN36_01170 [Hellea sp.]|nr:hypothetical protein [Hellea sp.]
MVNQKAIIILLAVQTALLAYFAYAQIGLQKQISALKTIQAAPVVEPVRESEFQPGFVPTTETLTSRDIRRIIQEELAPIESMMDQGATTKYRPGKQVVSVDTPETQKIRADISAQISALSSAGTATQAEMAKLETNLAKLPAEHRAQALGELNRAINAGYINVRF